MSHIHIALVYFIFSTNIYFVLRNDIFFQLNFGSILFRRKDEEVGLQKIKLYLITNKYYNMSNTIERKIQTS